MKAIIFDMDGVLCDSERLTAEAARRMFAERHGVRVTEADFRPFIGSGEDRYLGGVAAARGVALNLPADKDRMYAIYLEIIPGRLPALPGAIPFVAAARAAGLRLAVATSADRVKMDGNLLAIGLSEASFDACVTGTEILRKKPDPDIFLTAARRLGLPNGDCLVVEDAPNGVRAAAAAGSPCLALTSTFAESELRAAGARWIAPDLARVPEDLRRRLGLE